MLNTRTISIVAFGFLVGVGMAQTPPEDTSERLASLKKKREAVKTLHTIGTSVTRSASGSREFRIETWEKNQGESHKLRREVTSIANPGTPEATSTAPTLVVKDGANAWREVDAKGKKMVFRSTPKKRTEYHELESVASKGVVRFRDGGTIINVPCVLVEIGQKANPDDIIASYWIAEQSGVVLKSTVKSDGAAVTDWTASDVEVDAEISDTRFSYKPSYDAQVIQEKMGGSTRGD